MAKRKMQVKVYLERFNYLNDLQESVVIAQFISYDWAVRFIDEAKKSFENDDLMRIRVEVTH